MEDNKKQPSIDYNVYNTEALRHEVIKLIDEAYRNGYEAGKKAAIAFTSDAKEATVNERRCKNCKHLCITRNNYTNSEYQTCGYGTFDGIDVHVNYDGCNNFEEKTKNEKNGNLCKKCENGVRYKDIIYRYYCLKYQTSLKEGESECSGYKEKETARCCKNFEEKAENKENENKWETQTELVEIDTSMPINTTISPEEVKDLAALYQEKPIKSCADCIFCYLDKSDFVFKCKYYDDMSVYLLDPIQCDNRISGNEFLELKKRHYRSLKDFFQIIDAFNYFKKDGGCDSCGSQRCPANAKMLLKGNYCEEFKKWCAEE